MNNESKIPGVKIAPMRRIPDERGAIFHIMRYDDPNFEKFGEVYMSKIYPNAIKGWHLHKEMTLNYIVVTGAIKLVLYDDRNKEMPILEEIYMGNENYVRVTVPKGVWNGHKGIGIEPAHLINCATMPHTPGEMLRLDPFTKDIPYDWSMKCH